RSPHIDLASRAAACAGRPKLCAKSPPAPSRPPGDRTKSGVLRAGRAAVAVGGRAVTAAAEHERTRRTAGVLVARPAARPAGRKRGRAVQERAADLVLRVGLLREQHSRERAR